MQTDRKTANEEEGDAMERYGDPTKQSGCSVREKHSGISQNESLYSRVGQVLRVFDREQWRGLNKGKF